MEGKGYKKVNQVYRIITQDTHVQGKTGHRDKVYCTQQTHTCSTYNSKHIQAVHTTLHNMTHTI